MKTIRTCSNKKCEKSVLNTTRTKYTYRTIGQCSSCHADKREITYEEREEK